MKRKHLWRLIVGKHLTSANKSLLCTTKINDSLDFQYSKRHVWTVMKGVMGCVYLEGVPTRNSRKSAGWWRLASPQISAISFELMLSYRHLPVNKTNVATAHLLLTAANIELSQKPVLCSVCGANKTESEWKAVARVRGRIVPAGCNSARWIADTWRLDIHILRY